MKTRGMHAKVWRVEVEWEDSQLDNRGWEHVTRLVENRERVRCYSVGFVLADDDQGIVLASSVNGSRATGVVCIPASQIRKRRRLR